MAYYSAMDKRLKHGTAARKRTASGARILSACAAVFTLLASTLACSQGYLTSPQLTATADAAPAGIGGGQPVNQPGFTPAATELMPVVESAEPTEFVPPTAAPTATLAPSPTVTPSPTQGDTPTPLPPMMYRTQPGDTLPALMARFGVGSEQIESPDGPLPAVGFITPGMLLFLPNVYGLDTGPDNLFMPDSEIPFSPSALDFDTAGFIAEAGGYLSSYREYMGDGWNSAAEVINRVAVENSINPRLLLALIEYQSHWLYAQPESTQDSDYPLGFVQLDRKGLYKQLTWAMQKLSLGYYGWRDGSITSVQLTDGNVVRLSPVLNAGTAAIQYYFAQLNDLPGWLAIMDGAGKFATLYERMYGNPWLRASAVEPLLPLNLSQPVLELPFRPGYGWSFSGGPHAAWAKDGARAALDFAPPSTQSGCVKSEDWVTASAPGLVLRTGDGVVVVDLDGDGFEQTGWVILYLHIAAEGRVQAGTIVEQDARIGHPSCEGGSSTGTHVHIARKYNGEWVLAGGPLPFVLSGYTAVAGEKPYQGQMVRGDEVAVAHTSGSAETLVRRLAP